MTRVVGGAAGGRRLKVPPGSGTRPTSDRVREALFSSLVSTFGSLQGLHVLDLYAGSGALGLEAWSRGAATVTLVEHDRRAAATIRANAATLGCRTADVVERTVRQALTGGLRVAPDLVLSDPPYDLPEAALAEDLVLLAGLVSERALVVVERSVRSPEPRWPAGLAPVRAKRYGESVLYYADAAPEPPDGPGTTEEDP